MDADLQHDANVLPILLYALQRHEIAVATRYGYRDGGTPGWSFLRATASRAAARLTSRVLRLPLQDPLSGFFAVRREVFERCSAKLATKGFKVLLDLIVLSEARRLAEVPFLFAPRRFGRSKLGAGVVWAWMAQLSGLKPKRSRHALRVQTVTSVVTPMEGPA